MGKGHLVGTSSGTGEEDEKVCINILQGGRDLWNLDPWWPSASDMKNKQTNNFLSYINTKT